MTNYIGTEPIVVLTPMTCPIDGCGVLYALAAVYREKRREDGASWCCPNGHRLSYGNAIKSDASKLREAETREIALRDQLRASVAEVDRARQLLLHDRHRFANGVCPCCNRSFENVRRHMSTKHPDYDTTSVNLSSSVRFECSCGRSYSALSALRQHQTKSRSDDWFKPGKWASSAHLTKV